MNPTTSPTSVAPLLAQLNALAAQADKRPELTVGSPAGTPAGGAGDFAQTLDHAIGEVNQSQLTAHQAEDDFAMGRTDLPTTMLAVSRAQIEIDAAVQVRNRLVQAYNDIMQMSV